MKDSDLRNIVLQKFYDKRRDVPQRWCPYPDDFKDLPPGSPDFTMADVYRVCEQLAEQGLVDWKPTGLHGHVVRGDGKITAAGVDHIEGG
ncbi:MAG: hypothetical protein ACJ8NS_03120 [Chthoniobacterales bacterium]